MVLQQTASTKLNKINKIAPPGPPALPFVGMLPFLNKNLHLELHQLAKKYGNIYQLHVGGRKLLVLNGLEAIKEALVNQQGSFSARADFDLFKQPPQCYFMEMKNGEFWKKHRNIVGRVMHTFVGGQSDILESWAIEEAADLANMFVSFGAKPFDPNLYMALATFSFMQRLLFDKRGSLDNSQEDNDFVAIAHDVRTINNTVPTVTNLAEIVPAIWRPILMLYHQILLRDFFKAVDRLEAYLSKNIKQHQESFDPENLRDITDGLLKASSEQTESDRKNFRLGVDDIVKGTLAQVTGAGIEFPKLILHWGLLYMITYPEIQAQIQKELDEVVGPEQQPSLKHRSKLPFTEACINEIFRHASPTNLPAVPYGTVSDTTLKGYFIPQNTTVLVNYYSLTRDERYWEKPEQFNPYRFLDENGKLRKDLLDKFYPFGIGPRRCIGEYLGRLQIFLFFTNLMHRCKFEKVAVEKLSLEPQPATLLSPKDYRVVAKLRF